MGLAGPCHACGQASRAQGLGELGDEGILAVHRREAKLVPVAESAVDDGVRGQARHVVLPTFRGESADVVRCDLVRLVFSGSEQLEAAHGDRVPVRRMAGGQRHQPYELAAFLDGDGPQSASVRALRTAATRPAARGRAHGLGVHGAAEEPAPRGQDDLQFGQVREDAETGHWLQTRSIGEPGNGEHGAKERIADGQVERDPLHVERIERPGSIDPRGVREAELVAGVANGLSDLGRVLAAGVRRDTRCPPPGRRARPRASCATP